MVLWCLLLQTTVSGGPEESTGYSVCVQLAKVELCHPVATSASQKQQGDEREAGLPDVQGNPGACGHNQ